MSLNYILKRNVIQSLIFRKKVEVFLFIDSTITNCIFLNIIIKNKPLNAS